ncbi:MAG: tryptophan synthase subunit alpha, partial [Campylobacterales bacterium]
FLNSIKKYTQTPIYVGFGINQKTAKDKVKGADGVIVGSAFIDILLKDDLNYTQKIKECSDIAKIIKDEINS